MTVYESDSRLIFDALVDAEHHERSQLLLLQRLVRLAFRVIEGVLVLGTLEQADTIRLVKWFIGYFLSYYLDGLI